MRIVLELLTKNENDMLSTPIVIVSRPNYDKGSLHIDTISNAVVGIFFFFAGLFVFLARPLTLLVVYSNEGRQ